MLRLPKNIEVLEPKNFPLLFEPFTQAIATMAVAMIITPVIIFLPFFFLIKQSFLPSSAPHGALTPIVFLMSFLLIDTAKLMPSPRPGKFWQVLLRLGSLFLDINQKKVGGNGIFLIPLQRFVLPAPWEDPSGAADEKGIGWKSRTVPLL